ncbi:unnamed protein product [Peronospora farinosa]|uniref:Uncharacterized protein n=1 Tax=Peronospora farinosa TaxID=134698 RepID=A0AAV0SU32_9STRA|nr:unnamed protein product [Peronospora farinosa]CAI5707959.1 unnamed protein product [Peronospora farinosa]
MYTTNTRYSRHHNNNSYHQTQPYTSPSTKYNYSSPTKYNSGYETYSSPVKSTSYHQRSYAEYYSSPSSPTYYNQQQQQQDFYHSGASTASSSSQEGPFYADELDELDDYNMGMASAEMTTIPTVVTPIKLSLYEQGKTPTGRVMITAGNQTIEFFSCAVNAPLSRCMIVHE